MAAGLLCGGFMSVSPHETMEDLKKRLFSEEGRERRLLLLDNVKTLRFSWDELERCSRRM